MINNIPMSSQMKAIWGAENRQLCPWFSSLWQAAVITALTLGVGPLSTQILAEPQLHRGGAKPFHLENFPV